MTEDKGLFCTHLRAGALTTSVSAYSGTSCSSAAAAQHARNADSLVNLQLIDDPNSYAPEHRSTVHSDPRLRVANCTYAVTAPRDARCRSNRLTCAHTCTRSQWGGSGIKIDGATSFALLQKFFAIMSVLLSAHLGAASLQFAFAPLSIRRVHQSRHLSFLRVGSESRSPRVRRAVRWAWAAGPKTPLNNSFWVPLLLLECPPTDFFYISCLISSGVQGTRVCGSIGPAWRGYLPSLLTSALRT